MKLRQFSGISRPVNNYLWFAPVCKRPRGAIYNKDRLFICPMLLKLFAYQPFRLFNKITFINEVNQYLGIIFMYHRFSPILFPSHLAGFRTEWKTVWILISWLIKPADLDLHCFQILRYPFNYFGIEHYLLESLQFSKLAIFFKNRFLILIKSVRS